MEAGMRVAVIGTGIAGNAAAWTLSKRYPVTVYDREVRPGGHSHTVSMDYNGTPLAVDIGFIVYNELNYPDLTALFAHLGIETVQSCMSANRGASTASTKPSRRARRVEPTHLRATPGSGARHRPD
jgi:predicted NAD/FAD-binding protein